MKTKATHRESPMFRVGEMYTEKISARNSSFFFKKKRNERKKCKINSIKFLV